MGQVPFSPNLMKYYFLQELWLLVWWKKAGHPVSSSKIHRLSKKYSLPQASRASLADAEAAYQAASLRYQQLKPMAAELRSDFLHRQILEPSPLMHIPRPLPTSSAMNAAANPIKNPIKQSVN